MLYRVTDIISWCNQAVMGQLVVFVALSPHGTIWCEMIQRQGIIYKWIILKSQPVIYSYTSRTEIIRAPWTLWIINYIALRQTYPLEGNLFCVLGGAFSYYKCTLTISWKEMKEMNKAWETDCSLQDRFFFLCLTVRELQTAWINSLSEK